MSREMWVAWKFFFVNDSSRFFLSLFFFLSFSLHLSLSFFFFLCFYVFLSVHPSLLFILSALSSSTTLWRNKESSPLSSFRIFLSSSLSFFWSFFLLFVLYIRYFFSSKERSSFFSFFSYLLFPSFHFHDTVCVINHYSKSWSEWVWRENERKEEKKEEKEREEMKRGRNEERREKGREREDKLTFPPSAFNNHSNLSLSLFLFVYFILSLIPLSLSLRYLERKYLSKDQKEEYQSRAKEGLSFDGERWNEEWRVDERKKKKKDRRERESNAFIMIIKS